MATVLDQCSIPYDDFVEGGTIDSEQFDANNAELQSKLNAAINQVDINSADIETAQGDIVAIEANIDTVEADILAKDAANVKLTGAQNVAGIKTFTDNPVVPTPTTDYQASTKKYVDDEIASVESGAESSYVHVTGNETIAGVKTFNSSPIVPTPTTDYQATTKKYIDDILLAFELGEILDNSLTNDKLGVDIKVGSLALLSTTAKDNIVNAINEVLTDIANLVIFDKYLYRNIAIANLQLEALGKTADALLNFGRDASNSFNITATEKYTPIISSSASGQTTINVHDSSIFSVGDVILVQDATNSEEHVVASIVNASQITVSSNLSNTYTNGAVTNGKAFKGGMVTAANNGDNYSSSAILTSETGSLCSSYLSPCGLHLVTSNYSTDEIKHYTMTTPFDVSTLAYSESYSGNSNPNGAVLNPDGTKMLIANATTDLLYEYDLSTPWDISTVSQVDTLDILGLQNSTDALFLSPDGKTLCMLDGGIIDYVTMETACDISTMGSWGSEVGCTTEATTQRSGSFSIDGTKMYLTSDSYSWKYDLSTAFDPSTQTYDAGYNPPNGDVCGVFITPDGKQRLTLDTVNNKLTATRLYSAYTLAADESDKYTFDVTAQDTTSYAVALSPDGTKMYIIGTASNSVHQYTLSTPWLVGTATYDGVSFSVSSQDSIPISVCFSADGTKMYVGGSVIDYVFEYDLSTAWDVSTAAYNGVYVDVGSYSTSPKISFSHDGTHMYVGGSTTGNFTQWDLSTPWDLSTAAYSKTKAVTGAYAMGVSPDGTKAYIITSGSTEIGQYTMSTPYDITTMTSDSEVFTCTNAIANVYVSPCGSFIAAMDYANDIINTFLIGEYERGNERMEVFTVDTNGIIVDTLADFTTVDNDNVSAYTVEARCGSNTYEELNSEELDNGEILFDLTFAASGVNIDIKRVYGLESPIVYPEAGSFTKEIGGVA